MRCQLNLVPLFAVMFVNQTTVLASLSALNKSNKSVIEPGIDLSHSLKAILSNYDNRVRPFYGVKPVEVTLDILILSFGEIHEADMEYTMDVYLGQFWQDPRLALGKNKTVVLGGDFVDSFWLPDTFFVNSVNTKVLEVIMPNKKIGIDLNEGYIMLSARLKSITSCQMDLHRYPMDQQKCHLALESFSYDEHDLKYKWIGKVGTSIYIYDKEMAQFDVISAKRFLRHDMYHSRNFSGLTVTVEFRRRIMYYMFQMYIPCICIVTLSWISFWIDHEAVPARVGLSITTVLTICYMLASVNSNLPRVSYLKAIDYFLLASFGFIFLTLLEYVFVLRSARKMRYSGSFVPGKKMHPSLEEKWMLSDMDPVEVKISMGGKSYVFKDTVAMGDSIDHYTPPACEIVSCVPPGLTTANTWNHCKPSLKKQRKKNRCFIIHRLKRAFRPEGGENQIDIYSRVLFPLAYALFLTIYFVILFQERMNL